jgi:hypothetical protein
MTRFRLASLALILPLLAVLLFASTVAGPNASAARTSSNDALQTAQADPGAATVSRSVTLPLAMGGNLIGWPGFPTTTSALLADNAGISTIWVFDSGSQSWAADAAGLPPGVGTVSDVTGTTGLFVITSAPVDLVVPTALVSTTHVGPNTGEVQVWLDMTNPSAGTTSVLTRTPDGLQMHIQSDGLPAGAYTGWWRIWNDPSFCVESECNGGRDVAGSPGRVDGRFIVPWGTGFVVADNGIASLDAFLGVGFDALPNSYPDDPVNAALQRLAGMVAAGTFLDNPGGAQVDFILKWHGPVAADPDAFFDQTHHQMGGCVGGTFDFDPPANNICPDMHRVDMHMP